MTKKKKVEVKITIEPPATEEQNEQLKQIAKYAARRSDFVVNEDAEIKDRDQS